MSSLKCRGSSLFVKAVFLVVLDLQRGKITKRNQGYVSCQVFLKQPAAAESAPQSSVQNHHCGSTWSIQASQIWQGVVWSFDVLN